MIALDTSALMAILQGERQGDACILAIGEDPDLVMSAGTLAEALIVAGRRGLGGELKALFERVEIVIADVTPAAARKVAAAYGRWGKGVHPARLNMGDCYAYEAAERYGCRLLFVGEDFSRTDVESVL